MNWLAHVFLSPPQIEYQLGNLLADPMKGKCWESASEETCKGIALHLRIDAFTDAHPDVIRAKHLLAHRGALKGVVLDVLFDHFLSVHWKRFATLRRERFLHRFRQEAKKTIYRYPPEARRVVKNVVETKQLDSYAYMDGVKRAFMRIDHRLSPKLRQKDGMMSYLPLIEMHRGKLEAAFLRFFPDLMVFTAECADEETFSHWQPLPS